VEASLKDWAIVIAGGDAREIILASELQKKVLMFGCTASIST
jgi:hypothetical protein